MASETSATEAAHAGADAPEVKSDGGRVLLHAPSCSLTPDAAEALAELLHAAAEDARQAAAPDGSERRKPPFPPAELVSPHGAS